MEGAKRGMMLPMTRVLVFGAWLVAQSEAIPSSPTISIFLKPPGVIPPGGSATICCSCQCDNRNFVMYKNGHRLPNLKLHGSRAEFSISNATQEDAGPYTCHYLNGQTVLSHSETLDVLVQEFHLPKPVLSVLPGQEVAAGAHVVFHCTIAHSSVSCFLYLEGQNKAELFSKEQGDFNLSHAHKGHGGRYSCQCYTKGASFKWSAVSKTLDLVVKDYTWNNAVRLALGVGVLVLLGMMVAEAAHRPGPR